MSSIPKVFLLLITILLFIASSWSAEVTNDLRETNAITEPLSITPNSFQGTDVERINQAIQAASQKGLRVVIPQRNRKEGSNDNIWLLDSAILVRENTILELNNCHIKLSNRCRDNMIRSANCGLDITDIQPIKNIHIYGRWKRIIRRSGQASRDG